MSNETKNPSPVGCRCAETACGCAAAPTERCTCGEKCACERTCRCGGGCGCATKK